MSYTKRCYEDVMEIEELLGKDRLNLIMAWFKDGFDCGVEARKDYHQRVIDLWRATCDKQIPEGDRLRIRIMLWGAWENRDDGCDVGNLAHECMLVAMEQKYMR